VQFPDIAPSDPVELFLWHKPERRRLSRYVFQREIASGITVPISAIVLPKKLSRESFRRSMSLIQVSGQNDPTNDLWHPQFREPANGESEKRGSHDLPVFK
jgi:hypothetical protein